MKKVLVILAILFLSVPVFAAKEPDKISVNYDLPRDENIEKQIEKEIMPLLEEAKSENDTYKHFLACAKGYKIKKTGNPKMIKIYNDVLSATAIDYLFETYRITQDKKYLEKAFDWSKIAVKDRTTQIFAIRADIMLSALFLKPDEMRKAYNLYRAVDLKGATDFEEEYLDTLNKTTAYLQEKNAERKANIANHLKRAGYGMAMGLQSYATGMQNISNQQSANRSTTHCYTLGNDVFCDSY